MGLKIWDRFIANCIIYVTLMIYLFVTEKTFKSYRYPQKILFFAAAMVISFIPVLAAFLLFYYNIMPLPDYLLPYAIGGWFMAIGSFYFCNYCLRLLHEKDHGEKEDDIGNAV
jgi:amino acid transporter